MLLLLLNYLLRDVNLPIIPRQSSTRPAYLYSTCYRQPCDDPHTAFDAVVGRSRVLRRRMQLRICKFCITLIAIFVQLS